MVRFTRFVENAGVRGCIQTGVVGILVFVAIRRDFAMGIWFFTIPVLIGAIGFAFLLRNVLVDYFAVSRILMNVMAVAAILGSVMLPKMLEPEPVWMRLALSAVIGGYIAAYYLMLSDERVAIEH